MDTVIGLAGFIIDRWCVCRKVLARVRSFRLLGAIWSTLPECMQLIRTKWDEAEGERCMDEAFEEGGPLNIS